MSFHCSSVVALTSGAVMVGCATKLPLLRGDWCIANACRPPLYFDLLQLPNNLAELERQLRRLAAHRDGGR